MKGYRRRHWGLLVLGTLLMMGCGTAGHDSLKGSGVTSSPPEDILARVGDRVITVSEFQERFNVLPSERRQGATVEEQKEKALERLVQMTLFSLEARAENIDRQEPVASILRDIVDSILAREYYNMKIKPELTVTDEEINDYYDGHADEFTDPEMVRARHILIRVAPDATPEEWTAAEKKATELKREIDNGANFSKLAKEKFEDRRTKKRGGDLGFVTRENMPEEFPDIVFSLKEGEISEPVKGAKGYHIIKIEMKRPERIRTLAQVKGTLKQKLAKQKDEELLAQTIERLKEKYKVVLNTDLLSSVKVEKKKRKGG